MALQSDVSRAPMPPQDAERMRINYTYLEENIDASHLVGPLFQDGIISKDDMFRIGAKDARKQRNVDLLQTLLDRGNMAWGSFITALRESGYKEVTKNLKMTPKRKIIKRESTAKDPIEDDDEGEENNLLTSRSSASYVSSYPSITPSDLKLDEIPATEHRPNTVSSLELNNVKSENVNLKQKVLSCEKQNEELINVKLKNVSLKNKVLSLERQIEELSSLNTQQTEQLDKNDGKIKEQETIIDNLRAELEPLKKEVEQLRGDESRNRRNIVQLEKQVDKLQDKLKDLEESKVSNKKSNICSIS